MRVTGPDWPTTRALAEALADVQSARVVRWGASPCDKLVALARLYDAGVPVPPFTTDPELAQAQMWGRRRTHTQGRDISPRGLRPRHWASSDFWVQPLPSAREWRVHVWEGRAFRTGVKTHDAPALDPQLAARGFPLRSDRLGWQLHYSQAALDATMPDRSPLRKLAIRACKVLEVPGGAVDLLEHTDGTIYVLEVNTAPSLGEHSLGAWVEVLRMWGETEPPDDI